MLYEIIHFFEIMIYCQSNISESNAFYLHNRQHFFITYIFFILLFFIFTVYVCVQCLFFLL